MTKQDHFATRGISPLAAAQSHATNLSRTIAAVLEEATISKDGKEIDGIAVTQGPGMPACLGQGLSSGKMLSSLWEKPLIYCHHMAAHALTPMLTEEGEMRPSFPFLTLLLSGGHTMLVLANSVKDFKVLANTTDNSIGSAFDKTARALEIEWSADTSPGEALKELAASPIPVEQRPDEKELEMQKIASIPFRRIMKGRTAFS